METAQELLKLIKKTNFKNFYPVDLMSIGENEKIIDYDAPHLGGLQFRIKKYKKTDLIAIILKKELEINPTETQIRYAVMIGSIKDYDWKILRLVNGLLEDEILFYLSFFVNALI